MPEAHLSTSRFVQLALEQSLEHDAIDALLDMGINTAASLCSKVSTESLLEKLIWRIIIVTKDTANGATMYFNESVYDFSPSVRCIWCFWARAWDMHAHSGANPQNSILFGPRIVPPLHVHSEPNFEPVQTVALVFPSRR